MTFTQAMAAVPVLLTLGLILVAIVSVSRGSRADKTIASLLAELRRRDEQVPPKQNPRGLKKQRKRRRKALTI
jgi:hypothetical protein